MFKKNGKHPSPPFTRNKLIYRMLNKKVKGEGLKTLYLYMYARVKKKGGKSKNGPRVKNRKFPKNNIIYKD